MKRRNSLRIELRFSQSVESQRGMTLIEIMVVVIIMAMMASGIAVAVMKYLDDAKIKQATSDVDTLRSAVYLYRAQVARDCPDANKLIEEGYLERHNRSKDPWDSDFVVKCENREIDVFSKGPDMEENTEDDIR